MKKIIENYLYNIIYQVLVSVIPLVATPYIARVLGANKIGAYSYTQSVTTYFSLIGCLGLNMYGQRAIAAVQRNVEKRSRIFKELTIIRFLSVSITILIFLIVMTNNVEYGIFYKIHTLTIVASLIDISWFFQGLENFRITVIRNLFVKFGGLALIFLFVKDSKDIYIYTLINTVSVLVGNLTLWPLIKKEISSVKVSYQDVLKHIRPIFALFLPQIAASIYVVLDKVMLGFITGNNSEVAYFEEAQKIIKMLMAIVTSLGVVMMPRITYYFENNQNNIINQYMLNSIKFIFMIAIPMTFGISVCSYGFVPWYFGAGYERVIPNMIIISPIIIWIGISTIIGTQYFVATKRQREYTISILFGCFSNLVLNLILIPKYFSLGTAIATCIAELLVVIYQVIKTFKDFEYKKLVKSILKYLLSSLLITITIGISYLYFKISFWTTIFQVCLGIFMYFGVLILLKEENTWLIIAKTKRIIKERKL